MICPIKRIRFITGVVPICDLNNTRSGEFGLHVSHFPIQHFFLTILLFPPHLAHWQPPSPSLGFSSPFAVFPPPSSRSLSDSHPYLLSPTQPFFSTVSPDACAHQDLAPLCWHSYCNALLPISSHTLWPKVMCLDFFGEVVMGFFFPNSAHHSPTASPPLKITLNIYFRSCLPIYL